MTSSIVVPPAYASLLTPRETECAIRLIKEFFQTNLAFELNLLRVTAPLFVPAGTGINDDLNGVERPVSFPVGAMGDRRAEIVQSLAKWKRLALADLGFQPGEGLYRSTVRCSSSASAIRLQTASRTTAARPTTTTGPRQPAEAVTA